MVPASGIYRQSASYVDMPSLCAWNHSNLLEGIPRSFRILLGSYSPVTGRFVSPVMQVLLFQFLLGSSSPVTSHIVSSVVQAFPFQGYRRPPATDDHSHLFIGYVDSAGANVER